MPPQKNKKKSAKSLPSTKSVSQTVEVPQISATPHLDSLIRAHLYLLIFLIPLFFWPDTLTIFTVPKLLVFRTLSISSGIFILLKFFLSDKIPLRFSRNWIFLGFWLLSLVLSTVFTLNLSSSLFGQYGRYLGLFTMLNFLLIPVFIFHFFKPDQTRRLIKLSLIASSLAALYGLLQYFDFFGLLKFQFAWTDSPQNRVFGTFGHANHLGAYLAAHAVILCLYPGFTWLKTQKIIWKIIYPVLILLHFITLILTASRGALLAFILSILTVFIVSHFFRKEKTLKSKSVIYKNISIFIILIFLTCGALYIAKDSLAELGLFKRTEATVATIDKGKIPDRLSFLYSSLAMFADHPMLGTGLSTFRDSYSAYRRADYYIDGPGNAQYITVPEAAHNEYANILATQGLLGILAYLLIIAAAIGHIIKTMRRDTSSRNLAFQLALLGGLCVYLFQTIFNFGEITNLFFFYFLLGIIFTSEELKIKSFEIKSLFAKFLKYLFILICLFILVFWFKHGVIGEGQADYSLRQATLSDLKQNYPEADKAYQTAINARPQEYIIYQNYADFLLKVAATNTDFNILKNYYTQAVNNYNHSIQLNNNYASTYHNLGLAYLQLFRLTKDKAYLDLSAQAYQSSVDRAPNNPRYPYEYARKLHSDWNDPEGSIKLLKKAIAIDPDYQEPNDYLKFLYKNYPQLADPSYLQK